MDDEKYPYQKQWEDYRDRQVIFGLVLIGFFPYMFLMIGVIANLVKDIISTDNFGLSSFIIFAVISGICGSRLQYWKCPHCGKSFHTKSPHRSLFTSKCLHCKMPKYQGSTFYNDAYGKQIDK